MPTNNFISTVKLHTGHYSEDGGVRISSKGAAWGGPCRLEEGILSGWHHAPPTPEVPSVLTPSVVDRVCVGVVGVAWDR